MILLKYRMYIVFLMKQALKADNDGWTPRESKNEAIVLEKVSVFFFFFFFFFVLKKHSFFFYM
jgi:hypothetical protein